jgi:hypothetical protein
MDNPVPMIDDGRRVIVRQPDFDTVLEFVV